MHIRVSSLLLAAAAFASAQQYSITTVAGGAPAPTPATATNAAIGRPSRAAVDSAGNVYFSSNQSVYRLASNGTLTLVAGNGRAGFSGDGGPAISAQLNEPKGLAFGPNGNLYIADSANNRVRMVDRSGVITTFAGNGSISFGGGPRTHNDGGPATNALIHLPSGVAVDKNGNVYIADTGHNLIRKVTTAGIISTFAGDSFPGYFDKDDNASDDIPPDAINSEFNKPADVAVDSSNNVYVADTSNQVVRKITPEGKIKTVAGNAAAGYKGDDGPATDASMIAPMALAFDSGGNMFILTNGDSRIRKVDTKGTITTVAGSGTPGFNDGSGTAAQFNFPTGIAVDGSGNLYVADSLNLRIRKVTSGAVTTVAGSGAFNYSGDNGPALNAQLANPLGVAADAQGNVYIADTANNAVRRVSREGVIANVLGTGQPGSGDNQLSSPQAVAVDTAGNLYIADTLNGRIRRVSGGSVSTIGGTDNFFTPTGLAADAAGNVYVADLNRNIVRRIAANGTVTTVAGSGVAGFGGDNGPATGAMLNSPRAVAVDGSGNLYIADTGNNRVRRVSTTGQITTVAGNGIPGTTGDAGLAVGAQIVGPVGIAVDSSGNLYLSDGARIRKVFASGFITTIAGGTTPGYSGDGGSASTAQFNSPAAIAVDPNGSLYVADSGNHAIRRLSPIAGGMAISAVTSGATNQTGVIAPGEVLALYGGGMSSPDLIRATLVNGKVPLTLSGTAVYFNGTPAPVLYTSATQVGVVAPFGLSGDKADVVVTYQGQVSTALTVSVASSAPGLFTLDGSGRGQAVAVNQDGSINSPDHPAKAGDFVILYATGAGRTNPATQDGSVNPSAPPFPVPEQTVSVTLGGKSVSPQFAGGAPGIVSGVIQVNVQIPTGLVSGPVPAVLQVGSSSSPSGVTIYVQ
jgi:uncharacterized protein (TIGR03437 family)